MRVLLLLAACAALAYGEVESWKVAACERTNYKLAFCGDLGLSDQAEEEPRTAKPRPATRAPPVDDDGGVLRSFPPIRDRTTTDRPDPVHIPDTRCYEFQDRFYHYCFNITKQPKELREGLRQSCTRYRSACRGTITTPNPIDNLPGVTEEVPKAPSPCYHNCTEAHCTKRCKCDHYKPRWERTCPEDVVFPLWQQNCKIWYAACNEYYEIPPNYYTGKRVGGYGTADNTHASFWENKEEVEVDWADGQVKTGDVWAVPAVGVSGSTGVTDIRFPAGVFGASLGRKKRETSSSAFFHRLRKARRTATQNGFEGLMGWD